MKDYLNQIKTSNKIKNKSIDEERKYFILDYKRKGNNLVIHYANDADLVIPYTSQNEKNILSEMKNQIIEYGYTEDILEKDAFKLEFFGVLFSIIFLIINIGINAMLPSSILFNILKVIDIVLPILITYYSVKYANISKEYINDIKKHKLFIENELKINEYRKVNDITYEKDLTINDIDKVKLEELKDILINIEQEERKQKRLTLR